MSSVTNLNQFRKAKARAEKRVEADANAVKFGRSKAERARDKAEADLAARRFEGHAREEDEA